MRRLDASGGGGSGGDTGGHIQLLFLIMADGLPFSLDSLLNNPQFDFVTQFHQGNPLNEDDFFNFVDANDSPYDGLNMSSSYLDETELILSKKIVRTYLFTLSTSRAFLLNLLNFVNTFVYYLLVTAVQT